MQLSVFGQTLVILYTFLFSVNAFMCIGKFFHARPISTFYDIIVDYFSSAYVGFNVIFGIGYMAILLALAIDNPTVLVLGLVASSFALFIALLVLVIHGAVVLYDKLTEFHKSLGKRNNS